MTHLALSFPKKGRLGRVRRRPMSLKSIEGIDPTGKRLSRCLVSKYGKRGAREYWRLRLAKLADRSGADVWQVEEALVCSISIELHQEGYALH